jgi:hypothetical protein
MPVIQKMNHKVTITEPYEQARARELMRKAAAMGLTDEEKAELFAIITKRDPVNWNAGRTANIYFTANNKPVVGAEVRVKMAGKEQIVKTDVNGMAIVDIAGQSAAITAKKEGFQDSAITINV